MKVLAIIGSARKGGNTSFMVKKVFEELEKEGIQTEMVELSGQVIEPCRACWACGGKENCIFRKDSFHEIFEKMKEADGIILASPTYMGNVSSSMQAVLERASVICDTNREKDLLRHKVGAAITVARRGGALNALDTMNHFFLLQEMYIASSSYWALSYGRLPGEADSDEEGKKTMEALGKNMAYLLKALEKMKE